jgi:hypothetical protein
LNKGFSHIQVIGDLCKSFLSGKELMAAISKQKGKTSSEDNENKWSF